MKPRLKFNRWVMRSVCGCVAYAMCLGWCGAAEPTAADCKDLTEPILFCKQFNYQGLHIYDTFFQWRPGGGIYVLENPSAPMQQHRVRAVIDATTPQTLGEGVYFDPSLSYDAKKVLFSFKGKPRGGSAIYEIGIDGTGLRQISGQDPSSINGGAAVPHDVKPSYLPDGRIVFTSTRYGGLVPCANNGVAVLHVMNADGKDVHAISVNNVTEFDPNVLPDGRILFGRWEYVDRNALVVQSLWTVQPDGRDETALYANNMVFPEAILQAKPVPGREHLIVATFAPHNAPPRGAIAMIDLRRVDSGRGMGKNNPAAITNFEYPDQPTHDRGDSCDPWALNENVVLYSGVPQEKDAPTISLSAPVCQRRINPKLNALMLIDRAGRRVVVHSDPNIDLHNPILIKPRPLPRLSVDLTDRTQRTGKFFVSDVYASMPQIKRGSIKWLRVLEETSRVSGAAGNGLNQTFSISAAMAWSAKIYHGIVPVEADGSVYFEAPSGRALYFQLLDENYRMVRGMRTFIQAVPGATRSCIGCHEYSPRGSMSPRLLAGNLRQLRDESWGSGYMDYSTRIQPILDARCVSCHGGAKGMAKGLDLSRGWTDLFNISYEHLTARREKLYTADLIAGICCMNGTAHWTLKIFGPYEHGSGKAPLADILLNEPHRNFLTQQERELIFAWIDSNGMYFGTWDHTQAGAVSTIYRTAVARIMKVMKEARCTDCHADESGLIARFDQWINLDQPVMSRILRAPLPASTTAETGFGLALCRDRKVDQSVTRKGLLYGPRYMLQPSDIKPKPKKFNWPMDGLNYIGAAVDLNEIPTQVWPKTWPPEGKPITPFASVDDPYYRKMLRILQAAREEQLACPRVDMPNADVIGDGIIPGQFRRILPQVLPNPLPAVSATVDENGFVRLQWESSARTIGLTTEIHRGPDAAFVPQPATKIASTPRFEYRDTAPPAGKVHYALVFLSEAVESCPQCKAAASIASTASHSEPVRVSVEVPQTLRPALQVTDLRAEPSAGRISLDWSAVGTPGLTTYDVYARSDSQPKPRKLNIAPLRAPFFQDAIFHDGQKASYAVVAQAPRHAQPPLPPDGQWVSATPLPRPAAAVFDLNASWKTVKCAWGAKFKNATLEIPSPRDFAMFGRDGNLIMDGPFSFVLEVFFETADTDPVLLGFGTFEGNGWLLQRAGGQWCFRLSGVACQGGKPPVGQWVRVMGVYDGKTARLYQDGRQVAECAVPAPPAVFDPYLWSFPYAWTLGQYFRPNDPYGFKGKIRNLALYARALNAEGK